MWIQNREEKDAHPGSGAAHVQRHKSHPHSLVEGHQRHHRDGPHDKRVASGVEVHVLVASSPSLVSG